MEEKTRGRLSLYTIRDRFGGTGPVWLLSILSRALRRSRSINQWPLGAAELAGWNPQCNGRSPWGPVKAKDLGQLGVLSVHK